MFARYLAYGVDAPEVVSTTPKATLSKAKLKVGYVDGCFDMMHSGHYNAVRQAKSLCDRLVVGIHSDACIKANKGPPVMSQEERYSLLQHMKWADKIAFDVPYSPSCALLDKVGADFCIHGDDMPVSSDGTGTYDEVIAAGRLRIIKRTEGVSTTDFINRLMAFADGNKDTGSLREQNVQTLISTHRISQFSKPNRVPKESDKIVYIDGCFDLFHVGHATTLQQAKALGDFLVVGIHDDATVNKIKGGNYPIASLYERVLCLCACKWVDEVILAAPIVVTQDLIKTLNIDLVAVGSHTQSNHYREKGFTVDVRNADPYKIPREMGILRGVQSKHPTLTPGVIAARVAANRKAYERRNADRNQREKEYYNKKAEGGKTKMES